ncbi:MAG: ATP-binding protein [Bacteroidales bacterium]|nr:ATP-binding protein [Bacteroidales bacterium]
MIFYTIAIKSNKESLILFDEPDSNTFPFYTKFLAERIALDETNQFFITTHNPYLLLSLIEKSKIEDLNVFITQMEDYQTIVTKLNNDQNSQSMKVVHVECRPDEVLVTKLGFNRKMIKHHQGKSRVFHSLKLTKDQLAMVDEDPG